MASDSSVRCGDWKPWAKALASVAIVVQLLAVLAEPMRFFSYGTTRGSSPAADPVRVALAPYVEFAFLNHGYFFFAPEPGPSHLMQCELRFADGSTRQVRYPDKSAQRPRLLYHRHFMLSEFLNQLHAPPVDPVLIKDAPVQEVQAWTANRTRYEMVRDSMQRHLVERFGASSASIQRLRHILPGSDAVLKDRLPLNDPSLYLVLPDTIDSPTSVSSEYSFGPPLRIQPTPAVEQVEPLP
jgi:hypothetical protein